MKEKIARLSSYIILDKNRIKNVGHEIHLLFLLSYYIRYRFVHYRTFFYHVTDYLSASFTTHTRLKILTHHYNFLKIRLSHKQRNKLFRQEIILYNEHKDDDEYTIVLASSGKLEYEGSLSLYLKYNGIKIAVLSFTFVSGSIFNRRENSIAYITCVQRIGQHKSIIYDSIKHFNDIIPCAILMKSFEAMLNALNISVCVGISYINQITATQKEDKSAYVFFYDETWINYGGKNIGGNYLISLPLPQKPISLIKQTHRNRTVKKRIRLKTIYELSFQNMKKFMTDS